MSLTQEIAARYKRGEAIMPRVGLEYRRGQAPSNPPPQADKLWSAIKPKLNAELAPLVKRLAAVEKTRLTVKQVESIMDSRMEKSDKSYKKQYKSLYDKMREL